MEQNFVEIGCANTEVHVNEHLMLEFPSDPPSNARFHVPVEMSIVENKVCGGRMILIDVEKSHRNQIPYKTKEQLSKETVIKGIEKKIRIWATESKKIPLCEETITKYPLLQINML